MTADEHNTLMTIIEYCLPEGISYPCYFWGDDDEIPEGLNVITFGLLSAGNTASALRAYIRVLETKPARLETVWASVGDPDVDAAAVMGRVYAPNHGQAGSPRTLAIVDISLEDDIIAESTFTDETEAWVNKWITAPWNNRNTESDRVRAHVAGMTPCTATA